MIPTTSHPRPAGPALHPLTRWDALLSTLTGAAGLVLYLRTLAQGLLYGDSGEFQTLATSLGMSHPTGYPVYLLLARVFTLLPVGETATRVNLLSAVLAAAAVSCLVLIVRLLTGRRLAAVLAGLALAVAPLFWFFAIIAELYVPAAAVIAAVLLFLLLWRQSGKRGWLFGAGVLGGLSLGVHVTVLLLAPAVLVYLALTSLPRGQLPRGTGLKTWLTAGAGAAAGLLFTLGAFLILDGRDPAAGYYHATVRISLSAWGMTAADFDSPLERLRFLAGARQFNYALFSDPPGTMPRLAALFLSQLRENFLPPLLVLAGLGLPGLFLRRWREALLFVLGFGSMLLVLTNYDIWDLSALFVPTYLFVALWAGVALALLTDGLAWLMRRLRLERFERPAALLVGLLALGLSLSGRGPEILKAWQERAPVFLRGSDYAYYPYPLDDPQSVRTKAEALVAAVEDDAIVFGTWDLLFPYYYVAAEQGRTGIDFYETYPQEGVRAVAASAADYIENSIASRPVYFLDLPKGPAMGRFTFQPVQEGALRLYQVTGLKP